MIIRYGASKVQQNANGIRVFEPIGRCIYCDAISRYPSGGKLTREHIVPRGLEGQLIFREASCESCRAITHGFETRLLRGALHGLRLRSHLKTRKRTAPLKSVIAIQHGLGPIWTTSEIPTDDHPVLALMPALPPCNALRRQGDPDAWSWKLIHDDAAVDRLAQRGITPVKFDFPDLADVMRMLAKIAHGYALANVPPDTFKPTLREVILGTSSAFHLFIGGPRAEPPPTRDLWEVHLKPRLANSRLLLVVQFRLFGLHGGPGYEIVAGEFA